MSLNQSDTPLVGGVLHILAQTDVDSFDPQRSNFVFDRLVYRCLVRSLMTYPGAPSPIGAVPVPDLAVDYPEISNQNCTYTFHLRSGIRFAPPINREIQASDLKFSIERLLNPGLDSPACSYFLDIEGAREVAQGATSRLSGVEAPDEYTLIFHLKRPINHFLNILALPSVYPVPPEIAYEDNMIATGPYMVQAYEPGTFLRLMRNPSWDGNTDPIRKAYVESIEIKLKRDRGDAIRALENNEADLAAFTHPDKEDIQRYLHAANFSSRWYASSSAGCLRYIMLNTMIPPFDHIKVRQAINYALDKYAMREVRGGQPAGTIAHNILPPTIAGYEPFNLYPSPGDRGDVEIARQLLAEAGYPDGFQICCLIIESSSHPDIGRIIAKSLARVNIVVKLRMVSRQIYYAMINGADISIPMAGSSSVLQNWPGNGAENFILPLFDSRYCTDLGTSNSCHFHNQQINELIDQVKDLPVEVATQHWAHLDRLIMEQAACVPWLHDNAMDLTSTRVHNYFSHPFLAGPDWTAIWLDDE